MCEEVLDGPSLVQLVFVTVLPNTMLAGFKRIFTILPILFPATVLGYQVVKDTLDHVVFRLRFLCSLLLPRWLWYLIINITWGENNFHVRVTR